ncbi:protein trichome birefringence-like 42 [Humulus lupulus]|uniref:protein trichome birefringence-like 42 n=1 Tax=Humulus lupulus TaxID=3486 RepID=UPI002B40D730|nr:protein trichome birefringence-like 42 [Humulus lupulus]
MLCHRLVDILPNLINQNQGAIINDRSLAHNVLILQDLIKGYKRKHSSSRCLMKIDLSKAYDSVDWDFLENLLKALRFPGRFIRWVMICMRGSSYYLMMNGRLQDSFQGGKGLHQGDPISPLLFVIVMEYLTRSLFQAAKDKGMVINKNKSRIYFGGVSDPDKSILLNLSQLAEGEFPLTYLDRKSSRDWVTVAALAASAIISLSSMEYWWFGSMVVVLVILSAMQLVSSEENGQNCDFFEGSWVLDNSSSSPLYDENSCPFIGFNCLKNGRPDKDYLKYIWKPKDCYLPRFDGRDMLERNRGKKIMFVGDSLSNNMWQSLTCMLYTAVPNSKYNLTQSGWLHTFSFPEYDVSIMFQKNGFLVDLVQEKIGTVLKLDSISYGKEWKKVDTVIFNTYHWWTHTGRTKTWDYFQVGDKIVKEMNRLLAFKIALTTWAKWVDTNIDTSRTRVFFQGVSAVHINGSEWGDPKARNCQGQTQPVKGSEYPGPTHPGEVIVKNVTSSLGKKVYLLDITLLTQLRKDGHPSLYGTINKTSVDCSHWCLPGVPDVWNEILYAVLLSS